MANGILQGFDLTRLNGVEHKRRILLWLAMVTAVIVVLCIEALVPEIDFCSRLGGSLGPIRILSIFLMALVCEYIDSSLGMGYGTTLTPLLLLVGFEPLQIVPAVLLSEFVTGFSAGLLHQRDGNVDFKSDKTARHTALLLIALSAFGTLLAVFVAIRIAKFWLTLFIACIILSVGVMILATTRRQLRYRRGHIVALGALAAFNKGLSGGGYGPLVTGGQIVSGLNPKHAIAITSLAEGFTCLIGFTAYIITTGTLDWSLAVPLTLGAMFSVPMATLTVRKFPEAFIRGSVGVLTCLLGLLTFVKLFT
ncbi:sulfite exporter TauE/SafE family protein [bacterium]|nr:sulfite exporter TauE/SafE family protein [candidate division CSSED10-310 bacterium]